MHCCVFNVLNVRMFVFHSLTLWSHIFQKLIIKSEKKHTHDTNWNKYKLMRLLCIPSWRDFFTRLEPTKSHWMLQLRERFIDCRHPFITIKRSTIQAFLRRRKDWVNLEFRYDAVMNAMPHFSICAQSRSVHFYLGASFSILKPHEKYYLKYIVKLKIARMMLS